MFTKPYVVACSVLLIVASLPAFGAERIIRGTSSRDGVQFVIREVDGVDVTLCRSDRRGERNCTPSERQALMGVSDVAVPTAIPATGIGSADRVTCTVIPVQQDARIGSPYEGGCKEGMANGNGKYTIIYGDSSQFHREITGTFVDGKLTGRATWVVRSPSGETKGEAEFRNNVYHGKFRTVLIDGRVTELEYDDGKIVSGVLHYTSGGVRIASRYANRQPQVRCQEDMKLERNCSPADRQALLGVTGGGKLNPVGSATGSQNVGSQNPPAAHAQAVVQNSPASSTSRGDGPRLVPILRCGADKDMFAGVRPSRVGVVIAYFDKAGGTLESHEKVENSMRALISPTKQLTGCTNRADSIEILGVYEGEEQKCSTAKSVFDRVQCLTGGLDRNAAVARAVLKKDEVIKSSMSDLFWSAAVEKNKVAVENARRDAARAQQQQAEKARVDARHQATLAADRKAQAFADKHSVRGWLKYESLRANPFALEGQVYMFSSKLYEMKKATEGLFAGDIYIVDIPRGTFVDKSEFIIAGKVEGTSLVRTPLGTEAQFPKIKYLGSEKCSMSQCQDFGAIRR